MYMGNGRTEITVAHCYFVKDVKKEAVGVNKFVKLKKKAWLNKNKSLRPVYRAHICYSTCTICFNPFTTTIIQRLLVGGV